jgi:hypothetical protein
MDDQQARSEPIPPWLACMDTHQFCLLMVVGDAARVGAAMRMVPWHEGTMLVLTTRAELFRPAPGDASLGGYRFGQLPPAAEAQEFSLRLAQFQAGLFTVFCLAPGQAWLAELAMVLAAAPPSAVAIDLWGPPAGETDGPFALLSLVARLGLLVPRVPILALGPPMGRQTAGSIAACLSFTPAAGRLHIWRAHADTADSDVVRLGPALSASVNMRFANLEGDRERGPWLRRWCACGSGLIVAPGRSAAARLHSRLAAFGIDCGLYHAGLTGSERAAILAAHGDGRLAVLVGTEAVAGDARCRLPGRMIFSHPPTAVETLARFADQAVTQDGATDLTVLFTRQDLRELPKRARARLPSLGDLREALRYLLSIARQGYALLPGEGMPEAAGAPVRPRAERFLASLALLEAAGYCERLDYLPRAASLASVPGAQVFGAGGALRGATTRRHLPLQPLQYALKRGLPPDTLQRRFLLRDRQGTLVYRGHGRDRLYRLLRPLGGPGQVTELLADSVSAAEGEAHGVAALLERPGCRARNLADSLGWPPAEPCGRCDHCRPPELPAPRVAVSDDTLALTALADVPFSMRRGAAHRVVASALRGAGQAADRTRISSTIDRLLARGSLEVRPGHLGDLLAVSQAGRASIQAWDQ